MGSLAFQRADAPRSHFEAGVADGSNTANRLKRALFVGIAPLLLAEREENRRNVRIGQILRRPARQVKFKFLIKSISALFQLLYKTEITFALGVTSVTEALPVQHRYGQLSQCGARVGAHLIK